MQHPTGKLYLLPNTLGGSPDSVVPSKVYSIVQGIDHFIVEEMRSARRFLRAIGYEKNFEEVVFTLLNEHTERTDLDAFLAPAFEGKDIGLLSEAGSPCIADPGSDVVRTAHKLGVRVVPMAGASSVLLALISSGMNGQNFAFSGYLPREKSERSKRLRQLEHLATGQNQTQVFMDAPYRNDQVMQDLLTSLKPDTMLCVATDITCDNEVLRMMSIGEWKNKVHKLHKRPVMFVIGK